MLGEATTVVHATHLTDTDIRLLGETPHLRRLLPDHRTRPGRRHRPEQAPARCGVAPHPRLRQPRGHRPVRGDACRGDGRAPRHRAARALDGGRAGRGRHRERPASPSGWPDAGRIAVGQRADLVTIDTTSPRTAGTGSDEHTAVFAATAADVAQVMVDGRVVVRQGDREDIGRQLDVAIGKVWA